MVETALQPLVMATRQAMVEEARGMVDAARARGIVLRVLGGLATRLYCHSLDFCQRDHGDIDLIGRRSDAGHIEALFAELGYRKNTEVQLATEGGQLQFTRPCRHGDEWSRLRPHEEDTVDVFLDSFRLDHEIDLRDRLELDDYALSPTDLLLIKLQMARLEDKDERDVFSLLQDLPLATATRPRPPKGGRPGPPGGVGADGPPAQAAGSPHRADPAQTAGDRPAIDVSYLARRCADDWGLFHDVRQNLDLLRSRLGAHGAERAVEDRIRNALGVLQRALDTQPKPLRWRLRARIGTRMRWRNPVEEQD